VSGVLRITKGAGLQEEDNEANDIMNRRWNGQDLLYLVRNDGTVKVWERCAG